MIILVNVAQHSIIRVAPQCSAKLVQALTMMDQLCSKAELGRFTDFIFVRLTLVGA